MRATIFAASLTTAVAVAGPSHASESTNPATARLEWRRESGAEACIDADGLARAVNRRWRRNVFVDAPSADISVNGRVARTANGAWVASIELRRADGTSLGSRELVTAAVDCSALDDSVALAVGLMLDVSRRELDDERARSEHGANTSTETVASPAIAIPSETLAPRAPWRGEASLGAEGAAGLMPDFGVGVRAGVAVEPPRFLRVEGGLELWFPRVVQDGSGRGGVWSAWTAELAVCPLAWRAPRLALNGCVAQRFGAIRVVARGFSQNGTSLEPIWTVGPRAVATLPVARPLAVRAALGVDVPLVRYRFAYTDGAGDARTVYRMAPLALGLELGLALTF